MSTTLKHVVVVFAAALLFLVDFVSGAPFGVTLVGEAAAIVGAPLTPVSVAGVARRDTRRIVAVEATEASAAAASQQQHVAQQQAQVAQQQAAVAQQQAAVAQQQAMAAGPPPVGTVVPQLPPGCTQAPKGGVEYYQCGNVFYRSAFQGNNLVYVVSTR